MGFLFYPAIVKMHCLSKVILLLFPAKLFYSLLACVSNFIMFAIMMPNFEFV